MPPLTDEHLNKPILEFARQDFVKIRLQMTVAEALAFVRSAKPAGRIVYFYVVDDEDHLMGIVPTRRLLLSAASTPIQDIMVQKVIAIPSAATLIDACELFLFHRFLALPVIDDKKRIAGVVDVDLYTDELTDLARHTEHDDIFQLIGVHVDTIRKASTGVIFRNRFPWLVCNVVGGLACALIAGWFEPLLNRVIALALFIPVVLALAESVSIQSLTLTLQAQHGKKHRWSDVLKSLLQEAPVGMLLGVSCGFLVSTVAWIWKGDWKVALCLWLSLILSITLATIFGTLVPACLKGLRRDPKIASGPITLALADLSTLFSYLALATLLLR